jgi:hypothetical protein
LSSRSTEEDEVSLQQVNKLHSISDQDGIVNRDRDREHLISISTTHRLTEELAMRKTNEDGKRGVRHVRRVHKLQLMERVKVKVRSCRRERGRGKRSNHSESIGQLLERIEEMSLNQMEDEGDDASRRIRALFLGQDLRCAEMDLIERQKMSVVDASDAVLGE